LNEDESSNENPETETESQVSEDTESENEEAIQIVPAVCQYIIARYMVDGKKYVGKVTDVDQREQDAQVSFMKRSSKRKNSYLWPNPKDEILMSFRDILRIINEPVPFGKSKRAFHLNDDDSAKMDDESD